MGCSLIPRNSRVFSAPRPPPRRRPHRCRQPPRGSWPSTRSALALMGGALSDSAQHCSQCESLRNHYLERGRRNRVPSGLLLLRRAWVAVPTAMLRPCPLHLAPGRRAASGATWERSNTCPTLAPLRGVRRFPQVAFLMSDGDNIQWLYNNFVNSDSHYGDPDRNKSGRPASAFPWRWINVCLLGRFSAVSLSAVFAENGSQGPPAGAKSHWAGQSRQVLPFTGLPLPLALPFTTFSQPFTDLSPHLHQCLSPPSHALPPPSHGLLTDLSPPPRRPLTALLSLIFHRLITDLSTSRQG